MDSPNVHPSKLELNVDELTSNLSKAQHELSITQKKHKNIMIELKKWKEKALKTEDCLKKERRNNENNITQLGFKMLQFENELRKEQREIEHRFLEKDQQIRILQDVINSLHSKIKTNSLCYNCFMMKHNSSEQNVTQESFVAKFPLDMDFTDHKTTSHTAHEHRNRNFSLPLNMQSPNESPRSSGEFCFHHMLSPVPEELENSFAEHAKRVNLESTIQEEEEEIGEDEEDLPMSKNDETGNGEGENETESDFTKEYAILRNSETESNNEKEIKADIEARNVESNICRLDDEFMDSANAKNSSSIVQEHDAGNCFEGGNDDVRDEVHTPARPFLEGDLPQDVKAVVQELIAKVVFSDTDDENTDKRCSEDLNEEVTKDADGVGKGINNQEPAADKMPLSPKSEALVAEIKRAIFQASIDVDTSVDNAEQDVVLNSLDVCDQQDGGSSQEKMQSSNEESCENGILPLSSEMKNLEDTGMINVDLQLSDESSRTKTNLDSINVERTVLNTPEMASFTFPPNTESSSDALTDYDVIELD